MRLSRPLYETLPWAYMLLGAAALFGSYLWRAAGWSGLLAAGGLLAMVLGLMLVLKRRDYRIQKRRYGGDFDDED